ncbi:hypothetical protein [Microbacterium sp. VKM Ac-2923]|uniref:hypothetical protein n=1 Tax=Microbacterium sp. VKM Ac-2923 TaxID=2929476 RepID=UPI001FB461B5|nr:hypothetical protein [Microbacterium sp. VKM Ac-2923]MCJ1709283.1 hypothetical protein [Microbacterium sp. VKM Ac-2923]
MSGTRERIDAAVGSVLFNVSNFPEKAQSRLLGQDMAVLRARLTEAVLDTVSAPPADDVRGLCDQCGNSFDEHYCAPIPSCIHLPAEGDDREALIAVFERTPGDEPSPEDEHESAPGAYRRMWEEHMADAVLGAGFARKRGGATPPPPADDVREALASVHYCPEHGDLLAPLDGSDTRSLRCIEAHTIAQILGSVRPRGTVTDAAHDRDGMMICRKCGSGLTALDVINGENPCSGTRGTAIAPSEDMHANNVRELLGEARELVASWDLRGSWTTESPVGLIMRLANALEIEAVRPHGTVTPPIDDVRELVDQAKSHLERIEGEWGSSRSYEQLLERGDDEAAVIERVDRFLRGSAEEQRS